MTHKDSPTRDEVIVWLVSNSDMTLQDISDIYGITRERVRQIAAKEGVRRRIINRRKRERIEASKPKRYRKAPPDHVPRFVAKSGPGNSNPIRDAYVMNQYLLGRTLREINIDLGLVDKGGTNIVGILRRLDIIRRQKGTRNTKGYRPSKDEVKQLMPKRER